MAPRLITFLRQAATRSLAACQAHHCVHDSRHSTTAVELRSDREQVMASPWPGTLVRTSTADNPLSPSEGERDGERAAVLILR